jgi:hypothetical protein
MGLSAGVLGSSAVADSPLEVGLRIGLDEGVNGSNVSLSVGTTATSGSNVLVITADTHHRRSDYLQHEKFQFRRVGIQWNCIYFLITFFTIVTKSITESGVDCCHQNDQKSPQSDLRKMKHFTMYK